MNIFPLSFKTLVLSCLLLFFIPQTCYSQLWSWAKQNTGTGMDGYLICTDKHNNIYASGIIYTAGTTGFGNVTINTFPGFQFAQTVLIKYDSSGNAIWVKAITGGDTQPSAITCDQSGNILMYGVFSSPFITAGTFIVNNPNVTSTANFLVKYSPSGNVLWAKAAGTQSVFIGGFAPAPGMIGTGSVTSDAANNIYITGFYSDTANTFGGIIINNSSVGSDDVFLAKLDSNGNYLWAKDFGGNHDDNVFSVVVSSSENVYICGAYYSDSISIGGKFIYNNTLPSNSRPSQCFVAKFSPVGNLLWGCSSNGNSDAYGISMAADAYNNIYFTGDFNDPNMKLDSVQLNYSNFENIQAGFLVRIDSNGHIGWTKIIKPSVASDSVKNLVNTFTIAISHCGQVWLSGSMKDTVFIDGQMLVAPTVAARDPIFIAGYNLSGGVVGVAALGGGGDDQNGITLDTKGNIYVCSDFIDSMYAGSHFLSAGSNPNVYETFYLAKMQASELPYISQFIDTTICGGSMLLSAPQGSLSPYLWSSGDTSSILNGIKTGSYWVVFHDGCSNKVDTAFFALNIDTIGSYIESITKEICNGQSITLTATPGYNNYVWSGGQLGNQLSVNAVGTYIVSGSSKCGSLQDTFVVSNNNLKFYLPSDTFSCASLTIGVNVDSATFRWSNGSTAAEIHVDSSQMLTVTVNKLGCTFTKSIFVDVVNLRKTLQDTVVCLDDKINISLKSQDIANAQVTWSTGSNAPVINVTDTGYYSYQITDRTCSLSDTMHLTGGMCNCGCFIPSAFTPNQDGNNDGFKPVFKSACQIHNYNFRIYDRYGECLFISTNMNEFWNGTFKGQKMDMNVYMYEVNYVGDIDNHHYSMKGDVTLIR